MCESVCVYTVVCMSVTEGRREAAKCVCDSDRTRQLRGHGSSQLSAMSAVEFGYGSSQSQGEFRSREVQEIDS